MITTSEDTSGIFNARTAGVAHNKDDSDVAHLGEASKLRSNRHFDFERPRFDPYRVLKRARENEDEDVVPAKKTRRRPRIGKLTKLLDLPLDVFFEIASYLVPLDILHLSRTSKDFRKTFGPETSKHVWVAARRNIADLPGCPPDLNEAQYASLLFEHACQACGAARAKRVDYSLRVRFCGSCFTANVKKGSTLARQLQPPVPEVVYSLLPRSVYGNTSDTQGALFHNSDNKIAHLYYAPELPLIYKHYLVSQKKGVQELNKFIKQRQDLAFQMMQSSSGLHKWEDDMKEERFRINSELSALREASIKEKLLALGWKEIDFPLPCDLGPDWEQLVNQPRELTPRIWKNIQPKLEAILASNRNTRFALERKARLKLREQEFADFWNAYILTLPDDDKKLFPPNGEDACDLPSVCTVLQEDEAWIPITKVPVVIVASSRP